jgi:hypothetical protein
LIILIAPERKQEMRAFLEKLVEDTALLCFSPIIPPAHVFFPAQNGAMSITVPSGSNHNNSAISSSSFPLSSSQASPSTALVSALIDSC